ncbi:MAG: hypothetical protein AB8G22_17615 [Saprospiraceae bacterium]
MKIREQSQTIDFNLVTFTLLDIVEKMEEENFFAEDPLFIIEKIGENQITFSIPRDRLVPKQIHHFRYEAVKKKLYIDSYFKIIILPSIDVFIVQMILLYIICEADIITAFQVFVLCTMLSIPLFLLSTLSGYQSQIDELVREISIRSNFLLRQKGYKIPL